jgi:hypothetical protein
MKRKPWKCVDHSVAGEPWVVDGEASVLAVADLQQARPVHL